MEEAYFRLVSGNSRFNLSFRYVDEGLKINKSFNITHYLAQDVDSLITYIATEVAVVIQEKLKNANDDRDNIEVILYLNDNLAPKEMACSEVFQIENSVSFKVNSKQYKITMSSPATVDNVSVPTSIDNISLPSSIMANYITYPCLSQIGYNKEQLNFVWSKSIDKETWTVVCHDFIYEPTNNEIGCYLKLSVLPKLVKGSAPVEKVSSCSVEASPGICLFEQRHIFTSENVVGNRFRVVCYNVLSDLYCKSDHARKPYTYWADYALNIAYRKQLIIKEILGYKADLICLQEVDKEIYFNDFLPVFNSVNYGGDFTPKGELTEGLAFFFNITRFKLLETKRVIFAEHLMSNVLFEDVRKEIEGKEDFMAKVLKEKTTLQVNVVESLEEKEILVVANTHLPSHSDTDPLLRLLHGGLAMRYLEDFIFGIKEKNTGKRISLIFAGTFNSPPGESLFQFFTAGHAQEVFLDSLIDFDESEESIQFDHSLILGSACGTPQYTNFMYGIADCLDYIFYDMNNLEVTQVIPLPEYEELVQNVALPSIYHGSDHLALVADLKWLSS